MQKEINLLPQKKIGIFDSEMTLNIFRAVAVISMIIVASSFLGVIILGKKYSVDSITSQQADVRMQLGKFKQQINNQLVLIDRVNKIQSILKTRSLLTDNVSLIQKQLPGDVIITSFQITKADLNLTLSSTSLTSLKTFIDSLTGLVQKKSLLKKLTITDVVADTTKGTYSVNIAGTLL